MDADTARRRLVDILTELRAALIRADRDGSMVAWGRFVDLVDELNGDELKEDIVPYETWAALVTFAHTQTWIQSCPVPAPRAWIKPVDGFLTDFGGENPPMAVDAEEMTILEALKQEHPMTITQEDLASVTRLSDRTVRSRLRRLDEAGLTHRPLGPKRGTGLTEMGLAIFERR